MTQEESRYIRMTTAPVPGLICGFAAPAMVSMLVTNFYNLADSFFVGKLDTQSTAALGIVLSFMTFIQAVSFFFGHGSGNYISRELGARRTGNAETMAAGGLFSGMLTGLAAALAAAVFMDPMLRLLGSTETILPAARAYLTYLLPGTPFIAGCFVMNNQMRLQGNAFYSMIGILTGAALNIILDPILIFGADMGVRGAGLATSISQFVSFVIMLSLTGRKGGIVPRIRNYHPSLSQFWEICTGGLPSLVRQALMALSNMCLNNYAAMFGDESVAAFSIVGRVMMFASAALIGLGQGFQPLCGFNYGARKFDRVRKGYWFSTGVAAIYCSVIAVLGIAFPSQIVSIFKADDAEVIRIGARALRFQCYAFPLASLMILTNMLLQTTRKTVPAIIMATARQGLFFIPAVMTGVALFGMDGLYMAQMVSDICAFALAVPLTIGFFSRLGKTEEATAPSEARS